MFKGYSSKSKAKAGAVRAHVELSEVYLGDCAGVMKWGYMVAEAAVVEPEAAPAAKSAEELELEAELEAQVAEIVASEDAEGEPEGDGEVGLFPEANASMFAGIADTLQHTAPAAHNVASASRTAYKIEKDRPMQNGVKRPSEGGLCRAVWDYCWSVDAPTSKTVKAYAETVGWNTNNAMIEFYNWRKFNGINGRVAAPVAVEE